MSQWEVLDISAIQSSLNYSSIIHSDIDGVVLKLGSRNHTTADLSIDKKLLTHYNYLHGKIKLGYYWVTQALSIDEAIDEASYCHSILKNKQNDFPVYLYSGWGNESHTGRADNINSEERTSIALAWIDKMKSYGYRVGVYAEDSWFRTKLLVSYLYETNASIWVTRIGTYPPSYTTTYDGWNYTNTGTVEAIKGLNLSYFYVNVANWSADSRIDISTLPVTLNPSSPIYTGRPLTPAVTIGTLVKDTDYLISYSNNINIGYGICTCEGINNYCGISNTIFNIVPKSLEEYEITLAKTSYEFTNMPIIPDYSISGLEPGIDYTIRCENNILPGQATIYATGRGNYTGTISANYIVYMDTDMSTKTLILTPEKMLYTGEPCCPDVSIIGLTQGTDYTVSYRNNIDSGIGIVIATGKGNYTGIKEQEFEIEKCHISLKNIQLDIDYYVYDGNPKTPGVHIDGLTEGVEYTVEYKDNINAGIASAIVTGLGNYFGSVDKLFTINRKSIYGMTINVDPISNKYTGKEITPDVEVVGLTKDVDYYVLYSNNIERGTEALAMAFGKGNYDDTLYKNFTITKGTINGKTLSFNPARTVYTGSQVKPTPIIKDLELNVDYTISYSNNINVGTATGTATGIGNWSGTTSGNFEIVAKSIADKNLVLSSYSYTYDGAEKKPTGTISGLTEGVDFTISYRNNINAGTAVAIATGIGVYGDTVEKTYTINKKSIAEMTVHCDPDSLIYDSYPKYSTVNIEGLEKGVDYILNYSNNINVGIANANCTGIGNYTGTAVGHYTINPASIDIYQFSISPTIFDYDGTAKTPNLYSFGPVVKDVDYRIEYENNINAGIGFVNVIGINNYTNIVKKPFTIKPINIENGEYSIDYIPIQYYNSNNTPDITIYGLRKDIDFRVEYVNNTKIGTAYAKAIGINNYSGTLSRSFLIVRTPLRSCTVKLGTATIYSKYRVDGDVVITYQGYTLVRGKDYVLSERIEEDFGDFTLVTFNGVGRGNFINGRTYRFRVIPEDPGSGPEYPEYYDADDGTNIDDQGRRKGEDLDYTDPELIDIKTVGMFLSETVIQYNFGREIKPGFETSLIENKDYESHYSDNIELGTASVYVLGLGDYTGKRDFNFNIIPRIISSSVAIYCGDPDEHGHYDISNRRVVFRGERDLVKDVEYTESIIEKTDLETKIIYAEITITGIGNFNGIYKDSIDIGSAAEDIQYYDFTLTPSEFVYNKKANRPMPSCTELVLNKDYYIDGYANNIHAGTATITLKGMSSDTSFHTGTKIIEYQILPASIENAKIDIGEIVDEDYDHDAIKVIMSDNTILNKSTEVTVTTNDYTIEELKVSDVTAVGKGDYTGTIIKHFYLNDHFLDISKTDVHLDPTEYVYTGKVISPKTVSKDRILGVDYTIDIESESINIGEYTAIINGIGNYTGSHKDLTYSIIQMPIKQCYPTCGEPDKSGYYNPENFKLINPYNIELVEGTDYTLETVIYPNYEDMVKECMFEIFSMNNYIGTATYTYRIGDLDPEDIPINPETIDEIQARVPVSLENAPVYARATSSIYDFITNGIYLIYDNNIVNNRVRVVNSKFAFDNPCMITGWVNLVDILKKNVPFVVNDKVIVNGTLYQYSTGAGMKIEKDNEIMYITSVNDDDAYTCGLSSSLHTSIIGYCNTNILKHALEE